MPWKRGRCCFPVGGERVGSESGAASCHQQYFSSLVNSADRATSVLSCSQKQEQHCRGFPFRRLSVTSKSPPHRLDSCSALCVVLDLPGICITRSADCHSPSTSFFREQMKGPRVTPSHTKHLTSLCGSGGMRVRAAVLHDSTGAVPKSAASTAVPG